MKAKILSAVLIIPTLIIEVLWFPIGLCLCLFLFLCTKIHDEAVNEAWDINGPAILSLPMTLATDLVRRVSRDSSKEQEERLAKEKFENTLQYLSGYEDCFNHTRQFLNDNLTGLSTEKKNELVRRYTKTVWKQHPQV